MVAALYSILQGLPQSTGRNDDDIADRMNHRFTVSMLIVFAIILTLKQYAGDPIHCWHPAHFSGKFHSSVFKLLFKKSIALYYL